MRPSLPMLWGHDAAKKGDFLTAARAFEKAAQFSPSNYERLGALAYALQSYLPEGRYLSENVKSIIRIANSYGISEMNLRDLAGVLPMAGSLPLNQNIVVLRKMDFLERLRADVSADLHARWREDFAAKNGTDARRWKPAKDPSSEALYIRELGLVPGREVGNVRMTADGKVEIDIAHMNFQELTPAWQAENKTASRDAVDALDQAIMGNVTREGLELAIDAAIKELAAGRPLTSDFGRTASRRAVLYVGMIIHDRWLARNGSWAPAEQKVPFNDLDATNQKLDLNLIDVALKHWKTSAPRSD